MTKEELISIIEKCESKTIFALENVCFELDENGDFYSQFDYQIDDRDEQRDLETEIEKKIQSMLGDGQCSVNVERMDAFPNGYAYYKTTISKNY